MDWGYRSVILNFLCNLGSSNIFLIPVFYRLKFSKYLSSKSLKVRVLSYFLLSIYFSYKQGPLGNLRLKV